MNAARAARKEGNMTVTALLNEADNFYTVFDSVASIDFFSDSETAALIFYDGEEISVKKSNIAEIVSK